MTEVLILLLFVIMNILDLQTTYLSEKFYEKNPLVSWVKEKWDLKGLIILKVFTSFSFATSYCFGFISLDLVMLFVVIQLLVVMSNLWAYKNVNRD